MLFAPGANCSSPGGANCSSPPLLNYNTYAISMSTLENTFDFCVFCAKYLFGETQKYCYQYVVLKIVRGARCGERMGGAPPLSVTHRRLSKLSRARRARSVLPLTACAGCGTCPTLGSAGVGAQRPREPLRAGGDVGDRPARCKPRGTEPAKLHQIQIWRYFITFPEIAPN